MILEKTTALILLEVMQSLNTLGAKIDVSFYEAARPITVKESDGLIRVQVCGADREVFESRVAFERAYELL